MTSAKKKGTVQKYFKKKTKNTNKVELKSDIYYTTSVVPDGKKRCDELENCEFIDEYCT